MPDYPGSEAVASYLELCTVCDTLSGSECYQIKKWALSVCAHWRSALKDKLSRLVCLASLCDAAPLYSGLFDSETS